MNFRLRRSPILFFFFLVLAWPWTLPAVVSFQTETSVGYFKDIQQRQRFPFYLSWSYQGLHEGGTETSLQMMMNNDFSQNGWKIAPSYGSVVVPLGRNFRSRVEAGRLFWTEGFELALLDGAQAPIFWSETGGAFIYGGSTHVLDLLDEERGSIVGVSLFDEWKSLQWRVGWMGFDPNIKRQNVFASVFREFSWPLKPTLLFKQEIKPEPFAFTQSVSEITLTPMDQIFLGASYSRRNPRFYTETEQNFLYRLFAISPSEIQTVSATYRASEVLRSQFQSQFMRYNSGYRDERAEQYDLSLSWQLHSHQRLTPNWLHMRSYGGEVWSTGLKYNYEISEKVSFLAEGSSAYLEKINGIKTWAGHLRSGLNLGLAPRLSALTWIEFERNHLYEFDGRIVTYVTQFY